MRTALAALCLLAMIGLAVLVTTQIGGLDRRELAGLMGKPAPEQQALDDDPDATIPPEAMEEGDQAGAPVAAASPSTATPALRNVTGPGMTPAPGGEGPLEREAQPRKPPLPPRWKAYAPVKVEGAGLLDIGARKVRLAGIVPPADGRTCLAPSAGATDAKVDCAHLAMVALRRRIRAFGEECRISPNDTADRVVAPCRIGRTDLALWLVEQGWAQAAPKPPEGYASAEKEARCARRGMWRETDPPKDCFQN